ncbi:MAG: RNA-binding transcriptional accessory protein [Solobacterium sp.]|nr:RNA-binding transcriptional accessory protein [Solobacterium sp.]
MDAGIMKAIAAELHITEEQVQKTLDLLAENTVPFIARYRKEATHGLDEEQILFIEKQYKYEQKLAERKEAVLNLIAQQGKLTEEITASVNACTKLSEVEDLYKPYKQKKKTRAAEAIRKGLQPLADWILSPAEGDLDKEAGRYLNEEVLTAEDAVQGAQDIIAEMVSDQAKLRWHFKEVIQKEGLLVTKVKKDAEDEKKTYEMYYDRKEALKTCADHRIMAIDRAEKEKVITVTIEYDHDRLIEEACAGYTDKAHASRRNMIRDAVKDGCERLLFPSVENEIRSDMSEQAQKASIEVFSMNLEKLLLQPPIKGRTVMGFDPGFYNGCKLAVLDETGKMIAVDKIFPFRKNGDVEGAERKLAGLVKKYDVRLIAIGNGTASRESEKLVAETIRDNHLDVSYAIVSEAGASVWSAQEDARKEFPDLAVEERSAVSIGRRLLDPLAELIKIDPKAIGVGQYQHDLPVKELNERLDEAIMKCVNRTGADLNTASEALLRHISGLNSAIAREIVNYRNENGRFTNRNQLLEVKRLGPKAYTQCAGFLRIVGGEEPLDATAIHPESYDAARKLMKTCGIKELGQPDITFNVKGSDIGVDEYTLKDIEDAVRQPLRDYRDQFDGALLRSDVLELSDLHIGDKLSGTVRNVVDFGAFVDIGLHDDGLVHISRMSVNRIEHPSQILSVGDIVDVYIYEVDEAKHKVALSLLPLDVLAQRNKRQNNHPKKKKPEKKQVTMEDATQRLLERFGSKHK